MFAQVLSRSTLPETPAIARTFLLLLISLGYSVLSPIAAASTPPNVLILLADDLTWSDIGAYGAKHVRTPNIDALANQGMRFDQAFTGTAMCAPTRQQLYTGLFPVRSGAYPNHGLANAGTRSMAHALGDLGYRVGLSGKTHFGPESVYPFETVGDKPADDGGPNDVDLDAAKHFMIRDRNQPFALVLAFNESHEPWTKGDANRFDPETMHVPPYLVDTPETRRVLATYYAEIEYLDGYVGDILDFLDEAELSSNTLVIFTSEQGAAFPFAKWTLYDAGLRTAFVARWPEVIEEGLTSAALIQYVDVLPTLIDAASGSPSTPLDGESFLKVLRQEALEHREVVYGVHTNRGIILGNDYPIRSVRDHRYKFIWNLLPDNTYSNIRTQVPNRDAGFRSWMAAAEAGDNHAAQRVEAYLRRPEFEFYDTHQDPYELNNLANDAEFDPLMKSMRQKIAAWMRDQGDMGVQTERDAMKHMDERIVERIRAVFGDRVE